MKLAIKPWGKYQFKGKTLTSFISVSRFVLDVKGSIAVCSIFPPPQKLMLPSAEMQHLSHTHRLKKKKKKSGTFTSLLNKSWYSAEKRQPGFFFYPFSFSSSNAAGLFFPVFLRQLFYFFLFYFSSEGSFLSLYVIRVGWGRTGG